MKKTTFTEDSRASAYQTFFDETEFSPAQISVLNQEAALENKSPAANTSFLDNFLAAIKLVFLYLPGVAVIHFIMLGFALFYFYGDFPLELILRTLGIFAFVTFMIMLGIGKLSDLKYLKVVAAATLTSALAAVLYLTLAGFFEGEFFGFFAKITLPVPLAVGFFVKRMIDREAEN